MEPGVVAQAPVDISDVGGAEEGSGDLPILGFETIHLLKTDLMHLRGRDVQAGVSPHQPLIMLRTTFEMNQARQVIWACGRQGATGESRTKSAEWRSNGIAEQVAQLPGKRLNR